MQLSTMKLGLAVLLCHLLFGDFVYCGVNIQGVLSPSSRKRNSMTENRSAKDDAMMKAIEKGIFARRTVHSQPPGVWGRSVGSFAVKETRDTPHLMRPQSPAGRRALRESINHLWRAKEALDDLTKRISQPPGVWGKRFVLKPQGNWGKDIAADGPRAWGQRSLKNTQPGLMRKRSAKTQPPGVWGKRSAHFLDHEYLMEQMDSAEDDEIEARAAAVSQPPGVWGRRETDLMYQDEQ